MNWKRKFLAVDEENFVEEKIKQFESNTGSEMVLCIAKTSDLYPAAILRFAVVSSFICSFCFSFYFEFELSFYPIILQFVLFIFFSFVGKIYQFKKVFLSRIEMERETEEKSIEMFFLLGSSQSTHDAHLLFYISLLERKIKILIGKKLAEKIQAEELEEIMQILKGQFKQKKFFNGLTESLDILESKIKNYFPEKVIPNISNQIENRIFWQNFN